MLTNSNVPNLEAHATGNGEQEPQRKQPNPASAIHGFAFQIKLLMLFLHRGLTRGYSFRLGTEINEAKKFDDLVFEFTVASQQIFRFLQAKHSLDINKTITSEDLFNKKDRAPFSLFKYFLSYRDAKNEELFKGGVIQDVTICTNINFSNEILKGTDIRLEQLKNEDTILDTVLGNKVRPVRYKFRKTIVKRLKPILNKYLTDKKISTSSDSEIIEFLDHLVFAVECPNEDRLGKIIQSEVGNEFDMVAAENIYNKFYLMMSEWLQGKQKNRFLSNEDGKDFFDAARRAISIWFNVRDPVESFSGRDSELKELHRLLQSESGAEYRYVCIAGMGGVGKSELARKYISTYSDVYDRNVVWMNAENQQTLKDSFRTLATNKLGIHNKDLDGNEKATSAIVEQVYKFFSKGKSLLVLDNSEQYGNDQENGPGIEAFLPSTASGLNRPHILITSRNKRWPEKITVLELNVFNENEAIQFIGKTLKTKNNNFEADNLVCRLQYFPLALQQAVAYIRNQNYVEDYFTISDYIDKYKEKEMELLKYQISVDNDNLYLKTVYVTWNITLAAIEQKQNGTEALEVFSVIAYLCPEDIPVKILSSLPYNEEVLRSALALLKQYSMASIEKGKLSVHRLVQKVVRIRINEHDKEKQTLSRCLEIFHDVNVISKNVDHAVTVCDHSLGYNELMEETYSVSVTVVETLVLYMRYEKANLFGTKVNNKYMELPSQFRLANSEKWISITQNIQRSAMGMLTIASAECLLGEIQIKKAIENKKSNDLIKPTMASTCTKSEECLNKLLTRYKDILTAGGDKAGKDSDTRSNSRIAGMSLVQQGNYSEGLNILQKAKEGLENMDSHVNVLERTLRKVTAYLDQGMNLEALETSQEVILNQRIKKDNPYFMKFKNCIVKSLYCLELFDDSIIVLDEIIEILSAADSTDFEKVYDLFMTQCMKVEILYKQKKSSDADDLIEQLFNELIDNPSRDQVKLTDFINGSKNVFDDCEIMIDAIKSECENCFLPMRRKYLADMLVKRNMYGKALQLYQVICADKRGTGEDTVELLEIQLQIGKILSLNGEYVRALEVLKDVLNKILLHEQLEHNLAVSAKLAIAGVHTKMCDYDMAFTLYSEILDFQKNNIGEENLNTLETEYRIGVVLYESRKLDESLKVFLKNLRKLERVVKSKNKIFLDTKKYIAEIYFETHAYDKALQMYQEVVRIEKGHLGSDHINILRCQFMIGMTLYRISQREQSLEVFLNISKLIENAKDSDDELLLKTKCWITEICFKKGEYEEALKNCQDILSIQKALLKEAHPEISNTLQQIEIIEIFREYRIKGKQYSSSDERHLIMNNQLLVAVKKSNITEVKRMLDQGIYIDSRDSFGLNLLHHAVGNGDVVIINELLKRGADMRKMTDIGCNSLHIAVLKGKMTVVEILLQHAGANNLQGFINTTTSHGRSAALHLAAQLGHVEIVKALLKHGAIFDIQNEVGKTPLDLSEDEEVVDLLETVDDLFKEVRHGKSKIHRLLKRLKPDWLEAVKNACNQEGRTLFTVDD